MSDIKHLPEAEFLVMKAVWGLRPPISTNQIHAELCKTREWNISAVQTLLNRLANRGFVDAYKKGKNRYFAVIIQEDEYLAFENKSFLDKVNQSSLTKFVASLHDSKGVTTEDLDELMKYLDDKTKK